MSHNRKSSERCPCHPCRPPSGPSWHRARPPRRRGRGTGRPDPRRGVFTAAVYAAILWVMVRERTGHRTLVGRAADATARLDGSPRWFALPLLVSVLGAPLRGGRPLLGRQLHLARPRRGPAGQPVALPDLPRAGRDLRRGRARPALARDRLPRRPSPLTPELAGPGRPGDRHRRRAVRVARLPPRRPVAPAVRPGRHGGARPTC